jgi:hypothetical protein
MDLGDTYARLRPQLIAIAYQMLGSLSEAEDGRIQTIHIILNPDKLRRL